MIYVILYNEGYEWNVIIIHFPDDTLLSLHERLSIICEFRVAANDLYLMWYISELKGNIAPVRCVMYMNMKGRRYKAICMTGWRRSDNVMYECDEMFKKA